MAKKYTDFIRASETVTDKNKAIENFIAYAVNKLESMFVYKGLPDTIPQKWLEYYLMTNGNCFIAKHDGNLYAFVGGLGGEYDEYYQPTIYTVSNPYLRLTNDYKIDVDGVLIRNDTLMIGMRPILQKYGSMLVECDITTRIALINYRIHNLISASDDITNASAREYLSQIENGILGTIGENAFFDGVKVHDGSNNTSYFTQLIEITQYIKASFYNEIGLNANYNLKREYISNTENTLADDILLPLVDNMLVEREEGVKKVNTIFGTDITVGFASSWKTNDLEDEKQIVQNTGVIESSKDNGNG